MTATTTTALPKNKTGIFAGSTLQEVKSIRNQSIQHCHPTSGNLFFTLNEQNRLVKNGLQSSYPTDGTSSTTNDSYSTTNGIRNGFRPSTIRRQKSRITTAMKNRDNNSRDSKDISIQQKLFPSSLASAKLKSEIDQLNNQLKIYGDLNKILQVQNNRDTTTTPQSALSYSTSYRLSSASSNPTPRRNQQRFSSAITNEILNALSLTPDISNKTLALPSSPDNEQDNYHQQQKEIDHHITHTYQIPQQSNVGSESIFPLNSSSSLSKNKIRSTKIPRQLNEKKSLLCPFYVMYFTNLAMQQRSNNDNIENKRISSSISTATTTTTRKATVNSRYSSNRRQVQSPISMNTYSTIDDDNDSIINTTTYYNKKRFSAKIAAFENENSMMLKDILRTTSWNHLQV